jgi:hypothetical protein
MKATAAVYITMQSNDFGMFLYTDLTVHVGLLGQVRVRQDAQFAPYQLHNFRNYSYLFRKYLDSNDLLHLFNNEFHGR